MSQQQILALYETEPIGVGGKQEAVNVFYFCSNPCREQFKATRNPADRPLRPGLSPDAIEDTVCDHCDRLVAKDFYLNLPVCCAVAVRGETNVFDGQIVECSRCQRAIIYHVATGWVRHWKPCDRCDKPTSIERHNQAEPPEGEYCQRCGNWSCPDCIGNYDSSYEGNLCLTCSSRKES